MKRISAVVVFVFVISSFCFAQFYEGKASYNSSKSGFIIGHSSLSFNTRVRITNLQNGRIVEAVVDYRIPISAERIADISREAADVLQMEKTGTTRVRIEKIPARPAAVPEPAAPPEEDAAPPPRREPPAQTPAQAPSVLPPAQLPPLQPSTDIRYITVPAASQNCCPWPYLLAALIPLILAIIALIIALALLLRRLSRRPENYPLWLGRRYWCGKTKKRGTKKYAKKR
jgi:flagellar biogenesis protein FliO